MRRMARLRSWMPSRLRGPEPTPPAPAAAIRAGLGESPAAVPEAAEAELDTLRGELVRELDRLAADDDGSASFRRIAS
ncbi:MAG: hypothetical protein QOF65_2366 [Thermoleophilaceae bacterium]|nr:hypothetical protein [Thermoleophilaceae bacterium]